MTVIGILNSQATIDPTALVVLPAREVEFGPQARNDFIAKRIEAGHEILEHDIAIFIEKVRGIPDIGIGTLRSKEPVEQRRLDQWNAGKRVGERSVSVGAECHNANILW